MYLIESNPLMYNDTTDISDYNCGGFALQNFKWYRPISLRNRSYFEDEEDLEITLEGCTEDICLDTKYTDGKLIKISHYSEAPIGIEVVGFRIGTYIDTKEIWYDDFHFIWRNEDGKWWHKPGSLEIEEFKTDPDDLWDNRYNGEIVWFARVPEHVLYRESA